MGRKAITKGTETEVLLLSRRRCCVCYRLNRDINIKPGQIAHLDGNQNNSTFDNLAYLCLPHHDQYDSSTSQSKNFTITEVKRFKCAEDAHSLAGRVLKLSPRARHNSSAFNKRIPWTCPALAGFGTASPLDFRLLAAAIRATPERRSLRAHHPLTYPHACQNQLTFGTQTAFGRLG